MRTLHIEVIRDEPGFRALRDAWNELLAASSSDGVFLTWEWLHTWWQSCAEGRRLFIVVIRRGDDLLAIAPFAVRPLGLPLRQLLPTLEFLGTGNAGSDYLDIIVRRGAEDDVAGALAEVVAHSGLMLDLSRLPDGVPGLGLVVQHLERRGWSSLGRAADVCPRIRLAGQSWESYLASLGAQHRYNFRRRLRALSQAHVVECEAVTSESQRRDALADLVSWHTRRWDDRGGSTAFHTPSLLRFHDAMTRVALDRGWLRLFVLRLDGRAVSALYGLSYHGTFSFYQSGFDADFGRQSVGLVTMGLAIQHAFAEQLETYDFLHGAEPYKFLWARDCRNLVQLVVYPPRARGLIYSTTTRTRGLARRILNHARTIAARTVNDVRSAVVSSVC